MKCTRIQISFSSETAVPKEDCVSVAKISPLFSVGCVPTHALQFWPSQSNVLPQLLQNITAEIYIKSILRDGVTVDSPVNINKDEENPKSMLLAWTLKYLVPAIWSQIRRPTSYYQS